MRNRKNGQKRKDTMYQLDIGQAYLQESIPLVFFIVLNIYLHSWLYLLVQNQKAFNGKSDRWTALKPSYVRKAADMLHIAQPAVMQEAGSCIVDACLLCEAERSSLWRQLGTDVRLRQEEVQVQDFTGQETRQPTIRSNRIPVLF